MDITIPDEVVKQSGMSEGDLLVEVACRLFQAGKLTLHASGKLARLPRAEMENALMDRGIAVYEVTLEDLERDVENLRKSGV